MSYSVVQNTTFLTTASVLQKVVSFIYFTVVARAIGAENTGVYFFAITFTTIFTVVADFGLGPVLTREAARYPEKSEEYASTIFWTKTFFGLGAYLLMVLLVNFLDYPALTKTLVYLSGVTMFFDNLHAASYSVLRARKNLVFEAVGMVASQLVTLIIGSCALFLGWPLIWLIAAYTIPAFLNVVYATWAVQHVCGWRYRWQWQSRLFRNFILLSWPFALAGIISRLYSYSDSLLMSKILSRQELGWWSVPYKITFAFQFIPVALSTSIYPVMSGWYPQAVGRIVELFQKAWRYLFLIAFPLVFGLIVLAEAVVVQLYKPEYLPSVMVLRVLLVSLFFGFLSFITGALLNAMNRQHYQTGLLGLALGVNLILNLILLPRLGIQGAAIAALVSNLVLWSVGCWLARRLIKFNGVLLFKYAWRACWPALAMAVVIYWLKDQIYFLWSIPVGMLIYVILLLVSGGIDAEMLLEIRELFVRLRGKKL